MKTLTLTGLVVAGILFAAGSGVIGNTDQDSASKPSCCAAKSAATTVMATTTQEKGTTPSCCSEKEAGCCSEKEAATTLVTTEGKSDESCGGSCCASKASATTLVTTPATQEKTCDGSSCDANGSCCSDSKATQTVSTEEDATEGVCPVTLAMSKLPTLAYAVGEQRVCCENMAGELAKKESAAVHYVVADKTFEDKTEAMKALVDTTESMVNTYVTPKTCEVSGTTTVAGKSCSCPVETEARSKAVEAAVAKVAMKYMVDGQEAACGNCASARSKETGKPVEFVVAGKATTCEMTARLNLSRAKYQAAVEAVVALEKNESVE